MFPQGCPHATCVAPVGNQAGLWSPSSGYHPLWLPVWVQTEGRVEKSRIWSGFRMEFESCNVAGEKKVSSLADSADSLPPLSHQK